MLPTTQAYLRALAADDAWQAELDRQFGNSAGEARYLPQGQGEEGSELRRLYIAKVAADADYHAAIRAQSVD